MTGDERITSLNGLVGPLFKVKVMPGHDLKLSEEVTEKEAISAKLQMAKSGYVPARIKKVVSNFV